MITTNTVPAKKSSTGRPNKSLEARGDFCFVLFALKDRDYHGGALKPAEKKKGTRTNSFKTAKPNVKLHVEKDVFEKLSLRKICDMVQTCMCLYDDVSEYIEDKAYAECEQGNLSAAVKILSQLATFFEKLENKNEEIDRDLADIYLLLGQLCQYAGQFDESVNWFTRAIVVDDQYPVPFHSLAVSYQKIGNIDGAIRSLEQEIAVAPGTYYTYLLLADLYTEQNRISLVEQCLRRLLERDPENIQGLHKLITYYEKTNPEADVELLIRKLLSARKEFNRIEAVIRSYYFCRMKNFDEALRFISEWSKNCPDVTIMHVVKAYIYGEMKQFTNKRSELSQFKKKNIGHDEIMAMKLNEFGSIFGETAAHRLGRRLILSNPVHH